ncbi:MAG: tRNA glutamyl-Q(34) synthetase GluQRS [Methylococcaceae bacterium]
MLISHYVGRFAPSPTGHLHLGSVYTALASFLEARAHHGLWRLRFDDLDTSRNVASAVDSIFHTLDVLGLHWDGVVDYQSQHLDEYHAVLADLMARKKIYRCRCSRKDLTDIYAQTCRHQSIPFDVPHSLRLKTVERQIVFDDGLQGGISQSLATQHGDFILKRKDNIVAYQFAVVLDDARQAVNHIVRGMDLLDATPKQIYLQHILNLPTPQYLHVPILMDVDGFKLSKQTLATAVDLTAPNRVLFQLLDWLQQNPPMELQNENVDEILKWAIKNWNVARLKSVKFISI